MLASSRIIKIFRNNKCHPDVCFSHNEREILMGVVKGKTLSDVAVEMGLSLRTVNYFLCKIIKLQNCNSQQV